MMHEAKIGDPHLGRNFLGDSPSQIICHLLDLQKGNVFEKKKSAADGGIGVISSLEKRKSMPIITVGGNL